MKRILLGLVILVAAGGSQACKKAETQTTTAKGIAVRTAVATTQDLDDILVATGTLRPRAQVQLVAEVSARLMRVVHDEGARVTAGETLAQLDDTDYRLALDRAKAAQQVADANQAHAMTERERADNLLKTGGITDKDHLAVQVGLRVAEAALAQAKVEVAVAAHQLARCQIKAPFAGRVATRGPDPGTLLTPGTSVFTFVDDSVLEFRASLPSADYGRVRPGLQVEIEVDALSGRKVGGRITRITPLVDERTRSFEIVVEVPGQNGLAGGLFGRARVRVGTVKGAVVVPPTALLRDGAQPDRAEVFVVSGAPARRRATRPRRGLRGLGRKGRAPDGDPRCRAGRPRPADAGSRERRRRSARPADGTRHGRAG
jgi:RND family efflux transporter MFP subunit